MKIRDVIEALSKLDPELYAVGHSSVESSGAFDGISGVCEADEWHPALPNGAKYVYLGFDHIIPHMVGEGNLSEWVPAQEPPEIAYECEYCKSVRKSKEGPVSCKKCSWRPMMKPIEGQLDADNQPAETGRSTETQAGPGS
jgi:hypothetical protein